MGNSPAANVYQNSTILQTLLYPFKIILIWLLAIVIMLTTSVVLQMYFIKQEALLNQELIISKQISTSFLANPANLLSKISNKNNLSGLNIKVTRVAYNILNSIFFEITQINKILRAQDSNDFGYSIKQKFLLPHMSFINKFNNTLKILSLRIGNIASLSIYGLILIIIFFIDGLIQRKIRQKNTMRESSVIYYRAKIWRKIILYSSIIIYLCVPVSISLFWLLPAIFIIAILIFLQAKYFKKYL